MSKAGSPHAHAANVIIDCSTDQDLKTLPKTVDDAVAGPVRTLRFDLTNRAMLTSHLLAAFDQGIRHGLNVEVTNLEPHLRDVAELDELVTIFERKKTPG